MNIASNAIKYNREDGSVTLYCTELSSDDTHALYEFVCKDTGLGMSEVSGNMPLNHLLVKVNQPQPDIMVQD